MLATTKRRANAGLTWGREHAADREAIYPERLGLKLPEGYNAALDALASQRRQSKSELVRRAVLADSKPTVHCQPRAEP